LRSLLEPVSLFKEHEGYVLEPEQGSNLEISFYTIEAQAWYQKYFYGKVHRNFITTDTPFGCVVLSVVKDNDMYRALLRTQDGEQKLMLPAEIVETSGQCSAFKLVRAINPLLLSEGHITEIFNPLMSEELLEYEKKEAPRVFKFGLLLARDGQSTEREMFSNKEGSKYWDEFLEFLGNKVELKDFMGYNAGLSTSDKNTGSYSIYTQWKGNEIMWHVSTLLPYRESDPQQLDRKRHIGNDINVIFFFDGEDITVTGKTIKSQFIHNLIGIKPVLPPDEEYDSSQTKYKVSICSREDVPLYGPTLPKPAIFIKSPSFKDFLLTKMVNGENSAKRSIHFSKKLRSGRLAMLEAIVGKFFLKEPI